MGDTQYRYPPPPPSSYGVGAFFEFEDPNAYQYQIQYGGHMTRGNTNTSGDEDNDVIPREIPFGIRAEPTSQSIPSFTNSIVLVYTL